MLVLQSLLKIDCNISLLEDLDRFAFATIVKGKRCCRNKYKSFNKNSRISLSTTVQAARTVGNRRHLASVLQEGRKTAILTPDRESSAESRINSNERSFVMAPSIDDDTEGEVPADDTSADPEEGTYAEPGAYSNADGTTGYAGVQSDPAEQPLEGDYPASLGAAFAVIGLGIDLGVGVAFAGTAYAETAGIVTMVIGDMGGGVLGGYLEDD